jgi:plastocyanin
MIACAALLANALLFGYEALTSGPDSINLPHIALSLAIAGVVAIRYRWTPALAALAGALQLVEGSIFLGHNLTEPDSAATFAFAGLFFAVSIVALLAGAGATVQSYRAPRSRPLVEPLAPRWIYPAMLALAALVLGGSLATAVQAGGVQPGFSPEALAALPALTTRNSAFDTSALSAKVGETVVLRLENADTAAHYLDIDELNVHALIPPGKSNVALFKPTQAGTYTFYCHPHADKAARAGMVGTLTIAP